MDWRSGSIPDDYSARWTAATERAWTYSARVGGDAGITRLDAMECWWYQHGLRHMGEIEHARALVGLQGMTS